MTKTIEKYQRCSYGALETSQPDREMQSSYQEYLKLKAKVEVLQRSQRNFLGEELGDMGTKDLEQLEHQLDMSLKQVRLTKTQFMLDQLSDLQRKEKLLLETNNALRTKLEETNAALRTSWEVAEQNGPIPYGHDMEPLQCNSSLQIGYNTVETNQVTVATTAPNVQGFFPGWML